MTLGQELGFSELSILISESGIDFRYRCGMCLNRVLLMPGYAEGDRRRAVLAQGGKSYAQNDPAAQSFNGATEPVGVATSE